MIKRSLTDTISFFCQQEINMLSLVTEAKGLQRHGGGIKRVGDIGTLFYKIKILQMAKVEDIFFSVVIQ